LAQPSRVGPIPAYIYKHVGPPVNPTRLGPAQPIYLIIIQ